MLTCGGGRTDAGGAFDRRTDHAGYVSQREGDYARAQAMGVKGVLRCPVFPPAESSRKVAEEVMIAHVLAAAVLVAVPTEEERLRGAFFGSLVADALCLGSHYEYDAANIKRAYGGKSIETCACSHSPGTPLSKCAAFANRFRCVLPQLHGSWRANGRHNAWRWLGSAQLPPGSEERRPNRLWRVQHTDA